MSDQQQQEKKHWFAERQILLRSEGNVTYFNLSRPLQITLFSGCVMAGLYLVASATGLGLQSSQIEDRERHILALEESQKILVRQVDAAQEEILRITASYEENQQKFFELQTRKTALETQLDEKATALAGLKKKQRQKKETLTVEIDLLNDGLQELSFAIEENILDSKKQLSELTALRKAVREGTALPHHDNDDDNINLANVLTDDITDDTINRYIRAAQMHVDAMRKERDAALAVNAAMQSDMNSMDRKLGHIRDGQDDLIQQLEENAQRQIKALEKTLEVAGIEPDHIYRKMGAAGGLDAIGGPLQSLGIELDDTPASLEQVSLRENQLDRELERWNDLHEIMTRLPLASPVDYYYISSIFGRRRDPITRKWAMHKGIDMAAAKRTPILASAPGKVVFAGYKGAYGRMVEIDHGLGLRTRYGHMHKTLVKLGQEINFRDRIGLMGSTGRSTGSHLHYEILYDGQQIDPAKFIEAGRHVFKN